MLLLTGLCDIHTNGIKEQIQKWMKIVTFINSQINAEPEYTRMTDEELLERCRFFDCDLQDALVEVDILQNRIATIQNYMEWRRENDKNS